MARAERLAADKDLAVGRLLLPGKDFEELVLTLSLERRDPQDLAGPEREGDVGERLADLQGANVERGRAVAWELDSLALRRRLPARG